MKRGCRPEKLEDAITLSCEEKPLTEKFGDHQLQNSRNYKGMRECHIEPDWLLIYRIEAERLILELIRTGTHSDLPDQSSKYGIHQIILVQ